MIQIYNRRTNKYDTEAVAGEKYINLQLAKVL